MTEFQVKPLMIRKRLDKRFWHVPRELAPGVWGFAGKYDSAWVVVSVVDVTELDNRVSQWIHATYTRHSGESVGQADLQQLRDAVFQQGPVYQVFRPAWQRGNSSIMENTVHLWGPVDCVARLPNFAQFGTTQ